MDLGAPVTLFFLSLNVSKHQPALWNKQAILSRKGKESFECLQFQSIKQMSVIRSVKCIKKYQFKYIKYPIDKAKMNQFTGKKKKLTNPHSSSPPDHPPVIDWSNILSSPWEMRISKIRATPSPLCLCHHRFPFYWIFARNSSRTFLLTFFSQLVLLYHFFIVRWNYTFILFCMLIATFFLV